MIVESKSGDGEQIKFCRHPSSSPTVKSLRIDESNCLFPFASAEFHLYNWDMSSKFACEGRLQIQKLNSTFEDTLLSPTLSVQEHGETRHPSENFRE